MLRFIVIMLTCSCQTFGQGQNAFELISIKDGLSHNEIWGFEQDKYGYMWIATADGLNKYDGYNFEIFKNDPADSTSLPDNLVTHVLEDNDGVLWVSTDKGLSKYNRTTGKFKNYRFTNSTREKANFIGYLAEDSKGTLWAATNDGVRSFDKQTETFTNYEVLREDNVVTPLVNQTYVIYETKAGQLLCSSSAYGLLKFDYENKLFIQLKLKDHFQKNLRLTVIFSIIEDTTGNIWYGTLKGLSKINLEKLYGEEIINSITSKKFPSAGSLFATKNGKMWIGTWQDGLFEYDLVTKQSVKLPYREKGFFDFYADQNGLLWMGTFGGILKYNFDKAPFELYTFSNTVNQDKPIALCVKSSRKFPNIIWLGTNKGIYVFDKTSKSINNTSSIIPKLHGGTELNVEDLIETIDGKLIVATTDHGLFSCSLANGGINEYHPIKYNNSSLRFNDVNVLFEDSGNRIWIGQEDGLSILNEKEKTFNRIPNFEFRQYGNDVISFLHDLRKSKTPILQMIQVGDFADLSKEFVLSSDSYVLISCIGEGNRQSGMFDYGTLQSFDGDTLWSMVDVNATFNASGDLKNRQQIGLIQLKKGRYKLLYKTDDSHSFDTFNRVAPQDSLYWGIELYSISQNEFQNYIPILSEDENKEFMSGRNVNSIFESSDNLIWVSTLDGISIINPKSHVIKNIDTGSSSELSLSSGFVEDVCEDNFGNIWIATQDGLNKYDREKNKITVYREKEGLPSNGLRALQLDDDGNLWISSIKGISKVEINDSTKEPIFINYDVRDGLQGYTFIGNSSMRDLDGKLYFTGPDGFNAFSPGVTDKSLPNIVLNSLSISNKSIENLEDNVLESRDLNNLEEINLAYDQNDLSFEFASIHFARPDKNRLKYRLEGVDNTWHDGAKQIATYTNLDPGDYVFKVIGSNGDGIWLETPKELRVSITPAWWKNTYAYIGYGLIFFGFLYGVRKIEIERRSRITEYKQTQLRAEAAELKAKAAEAESRLLEAENERKTKELEEARSLQLSMLPKELPQLPNLDIAVYMKTATEVGGDYYDFHVGIDGVLTVVLGDATGHGMKAGTMVTTTKSLFNVLAPNPNIVETFHEMTRCLKLMQLEKLSMCMSMLKIAGSKVRMSSAGMPPIFIYKKDERVIEEHVIKGMPLGTMTDFPYVLRESEVHTGDTILMMSDGFPELLNDKSEAFGYKRVRNLFEESSAKTPEEIISVLRRKGDEWTDNEDPDDDITFVVIKVK